MTEFRGDFPDVFIALWNRIFIGMVNGGYIIARLGYLAIAPIFFRLARLTGNAHKLHVFNQLCRKRMTPVQLISRYQLIKTEDRHTAGLEVLLMDSVTTQEIQFSPV